MFRTKDQVVNTFKIIDNEKQFLDAMPNKKYMEVQYKLTKYYIIKNAFTINDMIRLMESCEKIISNIDTSEYVRIFCIKYAKMILRCIKKTDRGISSSDALYINIICQILRENIYSRAKNHSK